MLRRSWSSSASRVAVWLLLGATAPPAALAATIRVPEDFPSVLVAGDAAAPGDTILVGPGTWTETETRVVSQCNGPATYSANVFLRPGVSLIGSGKAATILEHGPIGGGFRQCILLLNESAIEVSRIEGLSLRGESSTKGIVDFCPGFRTEVRNCRIEGHGQGAARFQDSPAILEDCDVVGNFSPSSGGVVFFLHSGCAIRDSHFEGNQGGVLLSITDQDPFSPDTDMEVSGCVFENNSTTCISAYQKARCTIEHNLFLGNSGPGGGTGVNLRDITAMVRFNTFAYDTAAFTAGGVAVASNSSVFTEVIVENNTFWGCHGSGNSAAVANLNALPLVFRNNLIAASTGAPAMWRHGAFPQAISSCNDYWNNAEGDFDDWAPGATDFYEDPLVCDPTQNDFRLMLNSPCGPDSPIGCGLVGAWDVGCGPVLVSPTTWGQIKNYYR